MLPHTKSMPHQLSRRAFLKLSGSSLATFALPINLDWPSSVRLGRITELEAELHSRPDPDSPIVGMKAFDELLEVNREVIGRGVYPHNHVWLETPEGFLWSAEAQLVRNRPNPILGSIDEGGIWTEITVPFVDGFRSPDASSDVRYRLYYGMVLNVDQKAVDEQGQPWYRVHDENEVIMFAPGQAFRAIPPEEVAPLSPEAEDKAVVVDITRQQISAMESGVEVYFARISSGYAYYPEGGDFTSNTPIGQMWTWRKMVSRHMSGGDAVTGYDLPGVGWTVLFHGSGAALHSTYWHADYGAPRSRGCINLLPEDAKWFFRWTSPIVEYRPGDLTVQWPNPGTKVIVEV
jgi:lipoprotein-anchoring transpeptidase ErfK/SrfK